MVWNAQSANHMCCGTSNQMIAHFPIIPADVTLFMVSLSSPMLIRQQMIAKYIMRITKDTAAARMSQQNVLFSETMNTSYGLY